MRTLENKISRAQEVIRRAATLYRAEKTAVAWTGGKDSTVLLHCIRSVYGGIVPFPVLFNDSTMEFDEVYQLVSYLTRLWNLNVRVFKHGHDELEEFHAITNANKRLEALRLMKISAINRFQKKYGIEAFIAGIRRDEHNARSRETYFSARSTHMRVHPILHFTESDVWAYTRRFHVQYVRLYDQGYRSLGEKAYTRKAIPGQGERSGREPEKEYLMEKLRNMGYW